MTPQELKNSILQLAIQGKLVEQRPEEGTAEELYKQLQAEKDNLIKEGKIKRGKHSAEIAEEELPFDIPDNWRWCHPEDIGVVVVGATPSTANPSFWNNGTIPWLPSGCCQDCLVKETEPTVKYISQEAYDSCSTKMMSPNTIMIALTGATAGKVALLQFEACGNQSIVGITPFNTSMSNFLYYQLMARRREILSDCVGSAQPHISKDYVTKMLFPIPPLAEQKRIVAKIEELLPLIDRYEEAWTKLENFNKRFPEDMQKSILQMAIQGKLVPQDPSEGTGEELYKQIQAEKAKLVKEGKIKKEKPLPGISENEIPFEVPESWKWVKLGNAISLLSGTDFKPDEYNDQHRGMIYITGASSLSTVGVIESRWTEIPRCIARRGDVLLVCKGSGYGKTVICNVDEAHIARQIMAVQRSDCLETKYIMYYLNANLKTIKASGQGVIPGIDRGSVLNMAFPLPPLAEQKRIVAKLEELLPLCEKLTKKG